jgi:hypothetical protein
MIDFNPPVAAVKKSHRNADFSRLALDDGLRIERTNGACGLNQTSDDLIVSGFVSRADLMLDAHFGLSPAKRDRNSVLVEESRTKWERWLRPRSPLTIYEPNRHIQRWRGTVRGHRAGVLAMSDKLNVVVFEDGEVFIASGVEVYILAQGKSREEALRRLKATVRAELADRGEDLSGIGPAPASIQRMFKGPDSRVVARELLAA